MLHSYRGAVLRLEQEILHQIGAAAYPACAATRGAYDGGAWGCLGGSVCVCVRELSFGGNINASA